MITPLKIKARKDKGYVCAFMENDLCEYLIWLAGRETNINFQKPLRGAHISLINSNFDTISDKKLFEESCDKKWGDFYLDIPFEKLRVQRAESGFWGVYYSYPLGDSLIKIRRAFGVTSEDNYSPHFTICTTKGNDNLECFLKPKRYFSNFYLDK